LKRPALTFLAASGLTVLFTLFYARTNSIVLAEHQRFDQSLEQIQRLDSALNEDVLKVRFHLLEDYDSFGEVINSLNEALASLDVVPGFIEGPSRQILRTKIVGLSEAIREKSELLESFKTENAVLRNSLRYFPLAGRELVERLSVESASRDLEALVNTAMRRVLVYSLSPSEDQEQKTGSTLNELREWRTREPNHTEAVFVGALSAHAESILARMPKVEMQTKQIVSLPVGLYAKDVITLYEVEFGRAIRAAKVYRGILYALCGILLAMVGYTLYALRTANAHLKGHTRELSTAVAKLEKEATDRIRAETELNETHKELLAASRLAGMAEVATGVLHNVGNVLNSVNVSSTVISDQIKRCKSTNLAKVAELFREHADDLGSYITTDPKGKHLPGYIAQLSIHLASEQKEVLQELEGLRKNIEHIKEIVTMQQSYAKVSGVTETLNITELVEDTLRMNAGAMARHAVQVIREFEDVPPVTVEKHKVLQILVNLVRNAKYACEDSGRENKELRVRVFQSEGRVKISIIDNGIGIPPENLTRIFSHGFTTKKDGHGFGLHSGALAAKELGGALTVHSDGVGRGATFTVELPLAPSVGLELKAA
jgi:C4-dicarboxylate-specific signal transduction histidine kinase